MTETGENFAVAEAANRTPEIKPKAGVSHGVRVMRNTAIVFLSRGLGLLLAGGASVLLARYLGVVRMGEYGAVYAYVGLFGWLATWGFNPIVAREAAKRRDQAASIVFTGVCVSAAFSAVAVIAALALSPLIRMGGRFFPLLAIAAVEILLLVPFGLPGVIFQVDLKQWYSSGFGLLRQGIWFVIVVALYLTGAPLLYVILGRLAVAAVEAGLNWYAGHRFLAGPRRYITLTGRMFIVHGSAIALSTLAYGVYLRIDQVMLHSMVGDRSLGPYVVAVRVAELFEALPLAFISSLYPLLCTSTGDTIRFNRYLDLAYRYMIFAAVGLSVALCVGARPIIHLIYGTQYAGAAPLIAVLIWSEIGSFFGTVLNTGLLAKNLQNYSPWPPVVGAVINVGLNFYFIPRWHAMGAAWATVISYWLCWSLVPAFFGPSRRVFWVGFRPLAGLTAIGLLVSGAAFLLPVNDWVRVGLAVPSFAVIAWLIRYIQWEDFGFLGASWRGV
jgi:PST family polysaccharide transporter